MNNHRFPVKMGDLLGVGAIALLSTSVQAQVIPDDTLPRNERSRVERDVVRRQDSLVISGGARRDENLFHSFERFDIRNESAAYFRHPAAVQTIFSRVTGNDRSEIRGTLGVLGDADLYLLNPNGVLFGRNASLDLNGSLTVTSANALQFENTDETFSATNPEVPSPLLTVDPSASLFNLSANGDVVVRSVATTSRSRVSGLAVGRGENISLIGEDVRIEGGQLNTSGGSLEIIAIDRIEFTGRSRLDARARSDDGELLFSAQRFAINEETELLTGERPGDRPGRPGNGPPNGSEDAVNRTQDYAGLFISERDNLIDTDALLASSCITYTANGSVFLVTGSSGLPARPGETPISAYATETIRTVSAETVHSEFDTWELGDSIEEPQGLYQLTDGRVVLSQECR